MNFEELLRGRIRQLIALLFGILFLLAKQYIPALAITEEQFAYVATLIGSYVFAESTSGGGSLSTILTSHKFQAFLAGLLLTIFKIAFPTNGLSEVEMIALVGIIVTTIVSLGLEPQKNTFLTE